MQFSITAVALTALFLQTSSAHLAQRDRVAECPGVVRANDQSQVCCVGGVNPTVSFSLSCATSTNRPSCTAAYNTISTQISCATVISLSASNYESLVSAAASSLTASGTHYQTVIDAGAVTSSGTATQTSTGSAASANAATTSTAASAAASSTGGAADLRAQLGLAAGAFIAGAAML